MKLEQEVLQEKIEMADRILKQELKEFKLKLVSTFNQLVKDFSLH